MAIILGSLVGVAAVACDRGTKRVATTATPRAIPSPVTYAQGPAANYRLGDPTLYGDQFGVARHFAALPGATVDSGRLGGSIYQIEVPDQWNGRLVLYMKPVGTYEPTLRVDSFWLRSYLIRNGFAWGTTSFSSNDDALGPHADEAAALWDFFVQRYGRPRWTYITGEQTSGSVVRLASIRYPDRFDGALTICGDDPDSSALSDMFAAAAFAAGVTQTEFESTDARQLFTTRIRPRLQDPSMRRRYEDLYIGLTGGARPFGREGMRYQEEYLLSLAVADVAIATAGGFDNQARVYRLRSVTDVSQDEFNRGVVRRKVDRQMPKPTDENAKRYDLQVPLLAINTTGNAWFPIGNDQALRRNVDVAGKSDLLVQRTVRAPENCGLWYGEWDQGLADLVEWVEHGTKPRGEDLLADDLTAIGGDFTSLPRLGSPEAYRVPGADQRITLRGTLTLDDQPLVGGIVDATVVTDGLSRSCSFGFVSPSQATLGRYELTVASDAETRGCGAAGRRVVLSVYLPGQGKHLISQQGLDWPSAPGVVPFNASFSTQHTSPAGAGVTEAQFFGTTVTGVVLNADGGKMPPGTLIEAYIGDTLCGRFALPVVAMGPPASNEEAAAYGLQVAGPALIPACAEGAQISFRVDGQPVAQTAKHTLDPAGYQLDLKRGTEQ